MSLRTLKVLAIVALIISLSGNVAFAAPVINDAAVQEKSDTVKKDEKEFRKKNEGFDRQQDPVKRLEGKKERVQKLLKEGKITKEEANEITAKLDARIKAVREFNSLTVQQKKDKLIGNYRTFIEEKVKEGKITKEKAADMIKDYNGKVNKWDGSGYPGFLKKGSGKCGHKKGDTGK